MEEKQIFCLNCNNKLAKTANFCNKCGTPVTWQPEPDKKQPILYTIADKTYSTLDLVNNKTSSFLEKANKVAKEKLGNKGKM
ncbi:MAG: zinc ribbon domain-containing protein [Turicibacter sp.]|nr:zinc ribbon domain-containing protein [Turicibacter sp.]